MLQQQLVAWWCCTSVCHQLDVPTATLGHTKHDGNQTLMHMATIMEAWEPAVNQTQQQHVSVPSYMEYIGIWVNFWHLAKWEMHSTWWVSR